MPISQIPIPDPTFDGTKNFTVKVTLDGVTYAIRFQWNDRLSFWRAHLTDENQVNNLHMGVPLFRGKPLFADVLPGYLEVVQSAPFQGGAASITTGGLSELLVAPMGGGTVTPGTAAAGPSIGDLNALMMVYTDAADFLAAIRAVVATGVNPR